MSEGYPGYPDADRSGTARPGRVHVPAPQVPQDPWSNPQAPPGPAGQPTQPYPQAPYPQDPYRQQQPRPRPEQRRRPRPEPEPSSEPRRRQPSSGLPIGLGTLLGAAGAVAFLLALLVLPWFTLGGQDVGLEDLRKGFTVAETDPNNLPGANEEEPTLDGGIPSNEEVGDVVEDTARDTATGAAAAAIDDGKNRYLELYVETLWVPVAIGVGLAALFGTVLAPKSFTLGLILGFRRMAGTVTVLATAAHGAALWIVFTGDGADDPAFGVWLGIFGLAAVFVGCIVGPRKS